MVDTLTATHDFLPTDRRQPPTLPYKPERWPENRKLAGEI